MLKYYQVTSLQGYYLNACAIVVARDRGHARTLLIEELKKRSLIKANPDISLTDFEEIMHEPHADIIWDGNY